MMIKYPEISEKLCYGHFDLDLSRATPRKQTEKEGVKRKISDDIVVRSLKKNDETTQNRYERRAPPSL